MHGGTQHSARQYSEVSKHLCQLLHVKLTDLVTWPETTSQTVTQPTNTGPQIHQESNLCSSSIYSVLVWWGRCKHTWKGTAPLLRTNARVCGRTELYLTVSIPANCIRTKHVTPAHSGQSASLKQQIHKDLFHYHSFLFLQRILV